MAGEVQKEAKFAIIDGDRNELLAGPLHAIVSAMASKPPLMNKELEQLRRQGLFVGAQANNDLAGDLLKWTLGSLLLANGGALVALIGADELRTQAFKEAALFFGGGMLAALVGGIIWFAAFSLYAADGLRRAWDPTPLTIDDLTNLKTAKSTHRHMWGALVLWVGSLGLFAGGCISTVYLPEMAELDRLSTEYTEATARFVAEVDAYTEVVNNPNSTQEQRQAALDRVRAAQIESRIRGARVNRALDEPDNLLEDGANSLNSQSNARADDANTNSSKAGN